MQIKKDKTEVKSKTEILGWFSGKWQGLSNCGILSAIRSNPDIFEPVLLQVTQPKLNQECLLIN